MEINNERGWNGIFQVRSMYVHSLRNRNLSSKDKNEHGRQIILLYVNSHIKKVGCMYDMYFWTEWLLDKIR